MSESALNGLGIVVAMWTLTLPARDGTPSELISPNFEAGFYEELRGEVQGSKKPSRLGQSHNNNFGCISRHVLVSSRHGNSNSYSPRL